MSQQCAIPSCKKLSRALCYCCQKSVCLQHLKEHNDLLISQLNPLIDEINILGEQLKSIDLESKTNGCYQKIEEWRQTCHKMIDDFAERKYQEVDQRINEKIEKQRKEVSEIQTKISALIRDEEVSREDIDLINSTVQKLEQEVKKIEDTIVNINTRPIVLDDSLVYIKELCINRFNLSKLSSVYKTIKYNNKSCMALASNDQLLLMHQAPDLCLIDRAYNIVRQIAWDCGAIRSMCWSSSLHRFIIVSDKGVFFMDEKEMHIDRLPVNQDRAWCCSTCSDASLFLSTYELTSSVIEYSLLPTVPVIKEWKSPVTCKTGEWISDMKYNDGSIAFSIMNMSEKTLFIELRDMKTLDRLWSYNTDWMNLPNRAFYLSLVNEDEWLIMDRLSNRFLHITKDGKMKSSQAYSSSPTCATMFGYDMIAISTGAGVNFHKL